MREKRAALIRLHALAALTVICLIPISLQGQDVSSTYSSGLPVLSPSGKRIGEMTPIEAMHLMEFLVPRFDVTGVVAEQGQGVPLYRVAGKISFPTGEDRFEGVVDAQVARVLSVSRNGEPFWKWGGIEVSAHRGAVKFAPENTLAAIDKAIELGADIIEMDIRETKDGYLVICHDSTLERTTNGTGKISEKTLAELKQLDAGSWFGEEFSGLKIPTLREALDLLKGRAKPDIDFKAGSPAKLVALLHEMGIGEGVTLYCNDPRPSPRNPRLG